MRILENILCVILAICVILYIVFEAVFFGVDSLGQKQYKQKLDRNGKVRTKPKGVKYIFTKYK